MPSRAPRISRPTLLLPIVGLAACSQNHTVGLDEAMATSLYALVTTIDGTSFDRPLGPDVAVTGTFDPSLLGALQVVLESEDAAGNVSTLGTFDAHTTPRLALLGAHELYFVNVPAAAYFTDPSRSYRFRALLSGREIGRSDMSSKIFEVMTWVPNVPVGVKLRIEARPTPASSSLSPATLVAGSADFTLTVTGSAFAHDSIVRFGAQDLATTWVSATELTATVPATLVAQPGRTDVTVVTPAPGGGTSAAASFLAANPTPILTALSPAHAPKGSADLTLTLTGSSFVAGGHATFAGATLATTYVSPTILTAVVPAAALAASGEVSVLVVNPAPGGASEALAFAVDNPVPSVASLSPASATAGASALTLTVLGGDFAPGAVASFAGTALATTYESDARLTAVVPASLLTAGGAFSVVVTNVAPGGGSSTAATFAVNNARPTLASISPSTTTAGSASFTLTLTGSGFLSGATASLAGTALATTYVSSTSLRAVVPASLLTAAGSLAASASNPAPSDGASAPVTLTVNNPTPAIAALSPASVSVGSASFTLTVNGSGFVSGATASLGATALATTFVSGTQLTAVVPSALLTAVGTNGVTVANPAPVAGASGPLTFTVNNPTPSLTSSNPSTVAAGAAAFTLTVTGTGFRSGAVIALAGTALTTTFVSATSLTAPVSAAAVAIGGLLNITVTNPAPTAGASAPISLTVTNPAPTLTGLAPATAAAGSGDLTITLTGTNFNSSSYAMFGATWLVTSYLSPTSLSALVPAGQLAAAQTVGVTVVNPLPNGGTSTARSFQVAPAAIQSVGCFADYVNGVRDLPYAPYADSTNSVETCTARCRTAGYKYAGVQYGTQCFCGNTFGAQGSAASRGSACNMPCPGNSSETCGGGGANQVYALEPVSAQLMGCYRDYTNSVRDLTGSNTNNGSNNVESCTSYCRNGGWSYAAVQYGTNCFCGHSYGSQGTAATTGVACNMACPGNSSETCGGGAANSVYALFPAVQQSLGCYKDYTSSVRDLPLLIATSNSNNVGYCSTLCRNAGYVYAGLQGTQCFCGNSYGSQGTAAAAGVSCNTACPGGTGETCGGSPANSIYRLTSPTPTLTGVSPANAAAGSSSVVITLTGTDFNNTTYAQFGATALVTTFVSSTKIHAIIPAAQLATAQTVGVTAVSASPSNGTSGSISFLVANGALQYLGCFADYVNGVRDMPNNPYNDGTNSVETCANRCRTAGYRYAGVQNGSQCFCGNTFGSQGAASSRSLGCDVPCPANSAEICGAAGASSIYAVSPPVTHQLMGCYRDYTSSVRDMTGASLGFSYNTLETCAASCRNGGWSFAGLQYGTNCFCGNTYGSQGTAITTGMNCNMACPGNTSENCGGGNANLIYALTPIVQQYVGCFKDNTGGVRDLPNNIATSSFNNVGYCSTLCRNAGYTYAAVQYGTSCFCGNSYGAQGTAAATGVSCNMACPGGTGEICGGGNANSVYRVR